MHKKGQKAMKSDQSDFLSLALLLLTFFSFSGWYLAQQDNELLRQELEAQKSTHLVHRYNHNEGK